MRKLFGKIIMLLLMIIISGVSGCGGGNSGSTPPPIASQTVSGVAAAGSPVSGTVYLKDSSNPAKEISTSIGADGSFSFDVTGLTAPFLLKAVGTANGQNYTLYSLAGGPGTANINPLSHLAMVQANGGADPASLYASPTSAGLEAIKAALASIVPQIQTLLQQILTQYGVATTNFITDAYTANHLGLDLLFDMMSIVINNGSLLVSNNVSGNTVLSTTLGGSTLTGQIITANLPTVPTQTVGNVYIHPPSTSVTAGGSATFEAIVVGSTNQAVTWSVVESGGGSITNAGVYSAPASAGTYHVQATNATDTSKSATVTVTVTTNGTLSSGFTSRVSGTSTDLYGVAYGNGLFVVVGWYNGGVILTSTDGINWVNRTSGNLADLGAIAYANGLFVTVGTSGTILTSSDGITWKSRTSGSTVALTCITYGNNQFVAGGRGGVILTSSDGISWTARTSGVTSDFSGVAYGNGKYVMAGDTIVSSSDGITWGNQKSSSGMNAVSYGNGQFIGVNSGSMATNIMSSTDGLTWTSRGNGLSQMFFWGVGYLNGQFLVIGTDVLTSLDGATWTHLLTSSSSGLSGVTFGNGRYVIVGAGGKILSN